MDESAGFLLDRGTLRLEKLLTPVKFGILFYPTTAKTWFYNEPALVYRDGRSMDQTSRHV